MSDRILVMSGEGIGNFVQLMPTIRTIKENMGCKVDYMHAFGSYGIDKNICPYIDNFYYGQEVSQLDPRNYVGMVSTYWTRQHANIMTIKNIAKIHPLKMDESEVSTYLKMTSDMGIRSGNFIYKAACNYNVQSEGFDVCIADGYNRHGAANWSIKSYPYYKELVKKLTDNGYSVCSIGGPDEYIEGTVNKTGLSLLDSIGVIQSSKVFVGNDSGMYHCAASLDKPSVIIFTATSIEKNSHPIFHDSCEFVYRNDLECRPCQKGQGWKKCEHWACRNIYPDSIYEVIMRKKNESFNA